MENVRLLDMYFDLLKMKKTISSKRDLVMSVRRLNGPDDQIFLLITYLLFTLHYTWTLKTRDASEYLFLFFKIFSFLYAINKMF